jgi:hypothetical protein
MYEVSMSRRSRDEAWARLRSLAESARARDAIDRDLALLRFYRDEIAAIELRLDMAIDAHAPAPSAPADDE